MPIYIVAQRFGQHRDILREKSFIHNYDTRCLKYKELSRKKSLCD